ncbi:MAG: hypothetical protein ABI723_15515 [Bacteroidia bacterium]
MKRINFYVFLLLLLSIACHDKDVSVPAANKNTIENTFDIPVKIKGTPFLSIQLLQKTSYDVANSFYYTTITLKVINTSSYYLDSVKYEVLFFNDSIKSYLNLVTRFIGTATNLAPGGFTGYIDFYAGRITNITSDFFEAVVIKPYASGLSASNFSGACSGNYTLFSGYTDTHKSDDLSFGYVDAGGSLKIYMNHDSNNLIFKAIIDDDGIAYGKLYDYYNDPIEFNNAADPILGSSNDFTINFKTDINNPDSLHILRFSLQKS